MQFWTNELIAVVIIGIIGLILTTFINAWLIASKGKINVFESPEAGDFRKTMKTITKVYTGGRRERLFIISAALLACVGSVGVVYFAQDLWTNPLYVNDYDLNLQFIFIIFAIMAFFIASAVVALSIYSRPVRGLLKGA